MLPRCNLYCGVGELVVGGQYRILRRLGRGGFGLVYLVETTVGLFLGGKPRAPRTIGTLAVVWTVGELLTWGRSFNPGLDRDVDLSAAGANRPGKWLTGAHEQK